MLRKLIAAAVLVGAVGCNNGQPRLYLIAVDLTNQRRENLGQNCFVTPPDPSNITRSTYQNVKNEYEWAVWDGVDGKQYLDGANRGTDGTGDPGPWGLGDSPPISLDYELIESQEANRIFLGTKTISVASSNPNFVATRVHTIRATFEELGATTRGSLDLDTRYSCSGACPTIAPPDTGNQVSCSASLPFTGRRIDTSRMSGWNENP